MPQIKYVLHSWDCIKFCNNAITTPLFSHTFSHISACKKTQSSRPPMFSSSSLISWHWVIVLTKTIIIITGNGTDIPSLPLLPWFRSLHSLSADSPLTTTTETLTVYPLHYSSTFYVISITYCNFLGDRSGTVVKVLCYKSEGRSFDPRWCHWNFSLT